MNKIIRNKYRNKNRIIVLHESLLIVHGTRVKLQKNLQSNLGHTSKKPSVYPSGL